MYNSYLDVVSLVERLHRQFLEMVKLELDGLGIHDINNVQGLLLFNIGDAEMTVGELTWRGCYLVPIHKRDFLAFAGVGALVHGRNLAGSDRW